MRGKRKQEHIEHSLLLYNKKSISKENDIRFLPQELPEKDLSVVDLSTTINSSKWLNYLYINASTGGTVNTFPYLDSLADVANQYKLALAVGSQTAMIAENTDIYYKNLRRKYPSINIIANIPAHLSFEQAKRCVDSIEACMLQVHLNLAQEAVMLEGDRDFCGYLRNIKQYASKLSIPLIIKGVGYGIAKETLTKLNSINYHAIDVAGHNGINFVTVENNRRKAQIQNINNWGLSTFESLIEVKNYINETKTVFASGGIYTALDAIKCLALGANAVGIITPILNYIMNHNIKELNEFIESFLDDSRTIFRMLGCKNISEIQQVPLLITGNLYQYSQLRNIDILKYANR